MDRRNVLQTAAAATTSTTLARYGALNPPALRRLVAQGAQVRPFPQAALDARRDEAQTMHEEHGRADPAYCGVFRETGASKQDAHQRLRLPEHAFDSHRIRRLRR